MAPRGEIEEAGAVPWRRAWLVVLIGMVVLAAVLTPIVFDLSPR